MLKFENIKFNLLIKLINLHNSNISATVTSTNMLQDIITICKNTHYINHGEITNPNIDSA